MFHRAAASLTAAILFGAWGAGPPALAQATVPDRTTRLILLGTKGGPSLRSANLPYPTSQVLVVRGAAYVVDAGYGVTRQLVAAGVPLPSLRGVFITHHHSDHELEYGNLVYTAWVNGLKGRVDAYGPAGLEEMTRSFWEANKLDIGIRMPDEGRVDPRGLLVPHDIQPGNVFRDENVKVTALRNQHPPFIESFAFKFVTEGKTIVFSGDTGYFPPLAEFAKGADVLVHEAMYGPGMEGLARRNPNAARMLEHLKVAHTLVEDVGRIAQAASVKTLVLSHFVPGDDPSITKEMWESAARRTFTGKVIAASDLMEIPLQP